MAGDKSLLRYKMGCGRALLVSMLISVMVLSVAPTVWPSALAQTQPSTDYRNAECKVSLRNPQRWDASPSRTSGGYLELFKGPEPGTGVLIGPVQALPISEGSGEALAQAAAGQYCLNCLRDKLVWMDRFVEGTTFVSYTISEDLAKITGHVYAYYYVDFFLFKPTLSAPDSPPKGWVRAELTFFVPKVRFRETEATIMDMVRSFQFEPSDCWH